MIKDTNERIAITLTKEQVQALEEISSKTGHNKSTIIKMAISKFLLNDYLDLFEWNKKHWE